MSDSIDKVDPRKKKSLKEICFQAVRKHFVAVGTASIVGEYATSFEGKPILTEMFLFGSLQLNISTYLPSF